MLVAPSRLDEPIPGLQAALLPMGICLVGGCALSLLLIICHRTIASFAALSLGMGGFLISAVWLGLPIAARTNAQPICEIGRAISQSSDPAFTYRLSPPQPEAGFYAGRPVARLETPEEVVSTFRRHPKCLIVVQLDRREWLPAGGTVEAKAGPYVMLRFLHKK